jgi:uncharacterized protein YdaU (DUF1376 family)
LNFYKRYLGDYARDTAHLSLMEHGAYQVLLDTYYATGGQVPDAKEDLYRVARAMTPAERKAVDKVADQFFPVNGDGRRHNKRADEELTSYSTQAETNRLIAAERERKRKEKQSLDEPSDESLTNRSTNRDTVGSTNDQPKPEARSQKEQDQELSPPCGFVKFWTAWPSGPRKSAKEKCLTLWRRKKLEPVAETILAHVAAMSESSDWRGGYVPAPMVYLKDQRWDGADVQPQRIEGVI